MFPVWNFWLKKPTTNENQISRNQITVKDSVNNIFDKLNATSLTKRLEVFEYEDEFVENGDEDDMSTKFLKKQKLIYERYVNTLPCF